MSWAEKESLRAKVEDGVRRSGIAFDYVMVDSDTGDRFTISSVGGISFDQLAALSEAFGTKQINVGCDTGTGSDPCHSCDLHVSGARIP